MSPLKIIRYFAVWSIREGAEQERFKFYLLLIPKIKAKGRTNGKFLEMAEGDLNGT